MAQASAGSNPALSTMARNHQNLIKLRNKIDAVDRRIVREIKNRLKIAMFVGVEKKRLGLPISNPVRETIVLSKIKTKFMKSIFKLIIRESKRIQI